MACCISIDCPAISSRRIVDQRSVVDRLLAKDRFRGLDKESPTMPQLPQAESNPVRESLPAPIRRRRTPSLVVVLSSCALKFAVPGSRRSRPIGDEPAGQRRCSRMEHQISEQGRAPSNSEQRYDEDFRSRHRQIHQSLENRVRACCKFLFFNVREQKPNDADKVLIGGHHAGDRTFKSQIVQPERAIEQRSRGRPEHVARRSPAADLCAGRSVG